MSNLPDSRKKAKELNSLSYFTGKACPHGHVAPRRTDNGACTECQSLARKSLYATGWRQKYNKETSSKKNKKWIEMNPKEHWLIRAVGRARKRSTEQNLNFDITKEYLESILTEKCPIFNTEFVFNGNKVSKNESPSLDKIDPKKGYVKGNVAIISMKANVIKQNASSEDIYKVANWLKNKGY